MLLKTIILGILMSLYYFPIELAYFPGFNSKMMLAVVGIILVARDWTRSIGAYIRTEVLTLTMWALLFSLICFFSVVYNHTTDYTYATYFISMLVWLGGAYSVISAIRAVHGTASLQLVFHYIAWVCAAQCVLAIMIDNMPGLQEFVDRVFLQDIEFLHETRRLYGIGAYFDTAGVRFSCALLGLGYLMTSRISRYWSVWYLVLFLVIVILGNIVSRTTLVGTIFALVYMAVKKSSFTVDLSRSKGSFYAYALLVGLAVIGTTIYLYQTNETTYHYLRYGFEGFVNYFEKGEWSVSSTEKLSKMVVWPDNLKTWLIGDGWFEDPYDPNGFYMATDVGYLRFIFYCGLLGLVTFFSFFVYCTYTLCRRWRQLSFFFILLLGLGLAVWVKISTDLFTVYALLLLLHESEDKIRKKLTTNDTEDDPSLLAE